MRGLEIHTWKKKLKSTIKNGNENANPLTWILCKDSREGSSQSHVGSNFIVLFFLNCKLEYFRPNFMSLVPGVFEIWDGIPRIPYSCSKIAPFMAEYTILLHK